MSSSILKTKGFSQTPVNSKTESHDPKYRLRRGIRLHLNLFSHSTTIQRWLVAPPCPHLEHVCAAEFVQRLAVLVELVIEFVLELRLSSGLWGATKFELLFSFFCCDMGLLVSRQGQMGPSQRSYAHYQLVTAWKF